MAWSPEQLDAINIRSSNLLVAAAAGSGKTSVLVERIIRKVSDVSHPLDIDKLLVVTFTNAAAAEMRNRIGAALSEALQTTADTYYLEKQLALLPTASICTIHAFCQSLIRQYFYLLDLDPRFRIAGEAEIDLLKGDVLDKLFENMYASGAEGFLQLADTYGDEDGDSSLESLVLELYEFSRSHPWPEHWLDGLAAPFAIEEDTDIEATPWAGLIREKITYELEEAQRKLDGLISEALKPGAPAAYAETFRADRQVIAEIIEGAAISWYSLDAAINGAGFEKIAKTGNESAKELKERLQKERNKIKDKVKRLRERYFCQSPQAWLADLRQAAPAVSALTALVTAFSRSFSEAKKNKGLLDFNDLEHFALKVLLDESSSPGSLIPSAAARMLQDKFDEVMVDEYQDINTVQEAILTLVSASDRANRFMVGDVKQSIYRFRLAEPSLFMGKYHRYRSGGNTNERRVDLSRNYRSRVEIIDAVNFLFSQLMIERVAELEYGPAERLYPGPGYPAADECLLAAGPVELHLISTDAAQNGEPDAAEEATEEENPYTEDASLDEEKELTGFEKEARLIAGRIRRLKDSGCQVYDKQQKQYRPLAWRDVVVLLRSVKGKANILMDTLRQSDIPCYAELDAGYFRETEIQIVLSLLSIIDNPRQDIPLAAALRSPIGGFGAAELAEIRVCKTGAALWEALAAGSQSDIKPELRQKTSRFLKRLEQWRQLSRRTGVADLIWNIYRDSGFYDYVGGMPGGTLRQANLRAMYDRARQFEATNYRGLFRFLRFIERLRDKGSDLATARALGENEDVVRIMSIHKSKGLEFPVVVMADLGKGINLQDSKALVVCHKSLGVGPYIADPVLRYRYPTLARLAIQHKLNMETKAEELRILYVALTRAKEKLILVGSASKLREKSAAWCSEASRSALALPASLVASASSYLDWICPAVARHETGFALREYAGCAEHPAAADGPQTGAWEVSICGAGDADTKTGERSLEDAFLSKISVLEPVDAGQSCEWVESLLGWEYPSRLTQGKPAKLTVTEIKRRLEDLTGEQGERWYQAGGLTARPRFLQAGGKFSAAEVGTAMHTVMQHLDYRGDITAAGVEAQVRLLAAREVLLPVAVEHIDFAAVAAFFNTELGRRLQAARWVKRELPFCLMLPADRLYPELAGAAERIFVQGVIDCLFREGDGLVLLDYKTDAYQAAPELAHKYQAQLDIYAEAAEQILETPVREKYLYAFSGQQIIRI